MPNAPLETKKTDVGNFLGIEQPLFPDLGARNLRLFTGVEEELFKSLIQERPHDDQGAKAVDPERRRNPKPPEHLPANMSVSRNGSCMFIEGL